MQRAVPQLRCSMVHRFQQGAQNGEPSLHVKGTCHSQNSCNCTAHRYIISARHRMETPSLEDVWPQNALCVLELVPQCWSNHNSFNGMGGNKCNTNPRLIEQVSRLSTKTTHRFQRMLPTGQNFKYASTSIG